MEYPEYMRKEDDQEQVKEKLEALESLKNQIENQQNENKKPEKPISKYHTFFLKWKDGLGKLWEGSFTNKILSIKEQQGVGILRAKLAQGMPFDSLDPLTAELNLMLAHLSFSLTERPDWAKSLDDLSDPELLQAIYMEVLKHEARFRGRSDFATSGGSEAN